MKILLSQKFEKLLQLQIAEVNYSIQCNLLQPSKTISTSSGGRDHTPQEYLALIK